PPILSPAPQPPSSTRSRPDWPTAIPLGDGTPGPPLYRVPPRDVPPNTPSGEPGPPPPGPVTRSPPMTKPPTPSGTNESPPPWISVRPPCTALVRSVPVTVKVSLPSPRRTSAVSTSRYVRPCDIPRPNTRVAV